MHGAGFLLGLAALNFGEVESSLLSRDQWAEMLFAMGVQFQFSCACIAPTLAVSLHPSLHPSLHSSPHVPLLPPYSDIISCALAQLEGCSHGLGIEMVGSTSSAKIG